MRTSSERPETTADGLRHRVRPLRATTGAGHGPNVTDGTSYGSWMAAAPFESSTAGEFWLAIATSLQPYSDRTLDLRRQVLSYRAEHPRDPSLAQAVNDALRFIDLVPATATLPQVALADDGEVNFFWRGDGLLIDIGFVGDGSMHYYVFDEAQGVDLDASIPFSRRSLPRDIEMTMPRLRSFGTYSYGAYGRV